MNKYLYAHINEVVLENEHLCLEHFKKYLPDVKRVYYLYNVPNDSLRGVHAHKELYQFIFAVSGSFSIRLDDGTKAVEYTMEANKNFIVIKPGVWRELYDFSDDAMCMVIASLKYAESDYIRTYREFEDFSRNEVPRKFRKD